METGDGLEKLPRKLKIKWLQQTLTRRLQRVRRRLLMTTRVVYQYKDLFFQAYGLRAVTASGDAPSRSPQEGTYPNPDLVAIPTDAIREPTSETLSMLSGCDAHTHIIPPEDTLPEVKTSPSDAERDVTGTGHSTMGGRVPLSVNVKPGRVSLGSYRLTHRKSDRDSMQASPKQRIRAFRDYLSETKGRKINLIGLTSSMEPVTIQIPYIHRWTEEYTNRQMSKLYQLEKWHNCHKLPVEMLTLTTYQDGPHSVKIKGHEVTIEESFEILKNSWGNLLMVLRRKLGKFYYLAIMEPHKSGYPHLHVLIFRVLDEDTRAHTRILWSEKYGAGSKEHGVDFSIRKVDDIKSLRNYLMKYLSKTFANTGDPGIERYNTVLWEKGYRVLTSDQALSKIMKRQPGEEEDTITWLATQLENPYGDKRTIWTNEAEYAKLDATRAALPAELTSEMIECPMLTSAAE
jgi:hypothetical protein